MKNNRIFKLSAMSAAVTSALVTGQHAFAQGALEEVIVTATRRSESIQDIPLNISAIGGDAIESQGLSSLAEAMQWVPGIHIVDQGSRAADQIIVRGLSATPLRSSEGLGNDGGGTVATYVGEIPVYADLKLNDMDAGYPFHRVSKAGHALLLDGVAAQSSNIQRYILNALGSTCCRYDHFFECALRESMLASHQSRGDSC